MSTRDALRETGTIAILRGRPYEQAAPLVQALYCLLYTSVPQSPEDELDDRFVEACHMIEYPSLYLICIYAGMKSEALK